jgi:CrcB protein
MPSFLWSYITVAVGGALGAVARFGLTGLLHKSNIAIPAGTLASNLLGCLVMGVVAELVATSTWFNDAGLFPDHYRLLFAVGFCGSFTTLSALIFELNDMMQRDQFFTAFSYMFGTFIGGFAFFYLGAMVSRMFVNAQ